MKRILVTGAGGFVGTHLLRSLLTQADVEIFAAVYKSTSNISQLLDARHIIEGDLTDANFTQELIKTTNPAVIYHLAALSVVQDSDTHALGIMASNTAISYHLLESMRTLAPQARLIAIGSANAYGLVDPANLPIKESAPLRPLNPYAISKITQEMLALQYALTHNLDIVLLRPFNHTGAGQTNNFVIPALVQQIVAAERGEKSEIVVGNLHTSRDFTDVRDMVKAYILAAEKCQSGEIYNIGSGTGHSIQDIIDTLRSLTARPFTVKTSEQRARHGDVPVLIADATKFATLTGWKPEIPFTATLQAILDYWRSQ